MIRLPYKIHRTILAAALVAVCFVGRPVGAEPRVVTTLESSTPAGGRDVWKALMAGNARFVAGKGRVRELVETRRELAKGQHPRVVVLTCADSRLSPELIFDCNLGELFVVRTAGNIADPVVLGSIEYAVDHLHATALVVLGHEKCGAVAAAASGETMPTRNLEAIVAKIGPALDSIPARGEGDELVRQGVEANVRWVVADILKHSDVLKKEVDENKLTVFPAIYRLESGKVDVLK